MLRLDFSMIDIGLLTFRCFILFQCSMIRIHGQTCNKMSPYQECARYPGCLCFYKAHSSNTTICALGSLLSCSELVQCKSPNYECSQRDHQCIFHPRCHNYPVCYPIPTYNRRYCLHRIVPYIPINATWSQSGTTVVQGNGQGNATNQLKKPWGLCVDDDETVIIADHDNHRIIQLRKGDNSGQVIAGGNGPGNRLDQLNGPSDVWLDKETDSIIIADRDNRRIVQWSRRNATKQGDILINNVMCEGLAMDDQRYLYVCDIEKHEVRRYRLGEKNGTLVAGGKGQGARLDQFNWPTYPFVDAQQNVYVSDSDNHRVMKWSKGAKEGIIIAGGKGKGSTLTQLSNPNGLFIDTKGMLYVTDSGNNRIMRWSQGSEQGNIVAGGKGAGAGVNQFQWPDGLSFDLNGNIYVVDRDNNRVQRFSLT